MGPDRDAGLKKVVWKFKVVDAESPPLMVYHGTSSESRNSCSETPDDISFDYARPKLVSSGKD